MMQTSDSSSREGLNDLCDGDLFKSHPLFSKQNRFCLTEKGDFQTEFKEDSPKIVMRTKAPHAEHCQKIEATPSLPYVMGVKRINVLVV